MELTLKDRVLILNTVLPQFDTRKNMELKVSIDSKIAISEVDQKRIVIKDMGSGQINIGFTDAAAITEYQRCWRDSSMSPFWHVRRRIHNR